MKPEYITVIVIALFLMREIYHEYRRRKLETQALAAEMAAIEERLKDAEEKTKEYGDHYRDLSEQHKNYRPGNGDGPLGN